MDNVFNKMYKEAIRNADTKDISKFINTGGISCVILSDENKIYKGVNIIEDNQIKISAEEAALSNLISDGGKKVLRVVIVNEIGEVIRPSKKSYTLLLEFATEEDILVLTSLEPYEYRKLHEILPDYYGTFRIVDKL